MREFAEQEIVIPSGPFEGRRYACDRQPFSRLWFDEVDSGRWAEINTTGPSQSGKTLMGSVIPVLYHLFEVGETVIYGLPSMDMAGDKWAEDLLPAIRASRYRDLLPKGGAGAKGGSSNLVRVTFSNGATLRFMSKGGDDKSRAGFTARVLGITETDGMDAGSETSREADPIAQLKARTKAFGDRARVYKECTVSLESGRTWRDHLSGTQSRIAIRCPHCGEFVTPEREHLTGWQEAKNELEAAEKGAFVCPACGQLWTESDRRTANRDARLVHRGQTVGKDGAVRGEMPPTRMLSFRWTAVNNLLVTTGLIAQEEWRAARAASEDNAEREMLQFVWASPHKPPVVDLTAMDAGAIVRRVLTEYPRGHAPTGTRRITVGVDVGKWLCHWVAVAWQEHATPHVLDYGRLEVPTGAMSEERAILTALREFRDTVLKDGWESTAGRRRCDLALVDSGYLPESAYAFCRESGAGFLPSKGFGTTQRTRDKFRHRARSECVGVGDGFQVVQVSGVPLVEVNADHWKGFLHARLQTPMGQPGALTMFKPAAEADHLTIAKHFTAEKKVEEFVAGTGLVTRWEMVSRNNHYLDAAVLACVAAYGAGERVVETTQPPPATPPEPKASAPVRSGWLPERPADRPANWMDR